MKRNGDHGLRAFTLIEMVVVLGVLLVVATMAISQFKGYEKRGKKLTALTSAQALSTAMRLYHSEYNRYPACSEPCSLNPITYLGKYTNVTPLLREFQPSATIPTGLEIYRENAAPTIYLRGMVKGLSRPGVDYETTGSYNIRYYLNPYQVPRCRDNKATDQTIDTGWIDCEADL